MHVSVVQKRKEDQDLSREKYREMMKNKIQKSIKQKAADNKKIYKQTKEDSTSVVPEPYKTVTADKEIITMNTKEARSLISKKNLRS